MLRAPCLSIRMNNNRFESMAPCEKEQCIESTQIFKNRSCASLRMASYMHYDDYGPSHTEGPSSTGEYYLTVGTGLGGCLGMVAGFMTGVALPLYLGWLGGGYVAQEFELTGLSATITKLAGSGVLLKVLGGPGMTVGTILGSAVGVGIGAITGGAAGKIADSLESRASRR
jgi:hypothetical protein